MSTRGSKRHGTESLKGLVADYLALDGGCTGPREEVRLFRRAPALRTAIEHAGTCTNWERKRFSHQHRIPTATLARFARRLLASETSLRECGTFDDVHQTVEGCRVRGIGVLTVYDVALRIGAKLRKLPKKVYVHAGTAHGARKLGLPVGADGCIKRSDLPPPLRRLPPYQVEDFLCIYKDDLDPSMCKA
jgi:hypothetical protein